MNPKELLKRVDLPKDRLEEEVANAFAASGITEGYEDTVGAFSTDTVLKGRECIRDLLLETVRSSTRPPVAAPHSEGRPGMRTRTEHPVRSADMTVA